MIWDSIGNVLRVVYDTEMAGDEDRARQELECVYGGAVSLAALSDARKPIKEREQLARMLSALSVYGDKGPFVK